MSSREKRLEQARWGENIPITGTFLGGPGVNVTSLAGTLPTGAGTICHLERSRHMLVTFPPGGMGNVPQIMLVTLQLYQEPATLKRHAPRQGAGELPSSEQRAEQVR